MPLLNSFNKLSYFFKSLLSIHQPVVYLPFLKVNLLETINLKSSFFKFIYYTYIYICACISFIHRLNYLLHKENKENGEKERIGRIFCPLFRCKVGIFSTGVHTFIEWKFHNSASTPFNLAQMFKDSWAFSPRFSRPTVCHHPPSAGNVPAEITQSRSTTIPSLLFSSSLSHFHGIATCYFAYNHRLAFARRNSVEGNFSPLFFPNLPSTSNLHNNSCVRLIMLDGLLAYLP